MNYLTEHEFDQLIDAIRKRPQKTFSGYWLNLITFKNCHFIQGNIDDGRSERGINRNIAALVDEISADDIKGVWPEVMGYPIEESEEEQLVQFLSSQHENRIELIVPERNLARPVEWERFDFTGEFVVYATFIYPAILEVLSTITFKTVIDMGCGSGNLIQHIHNHFPDVVCYGIDINPNNIEAAKEMNIPNIFLGDCSFVNNILSDDLFFDVAIFSGLLNRQVTKKEEAISILAETLKRIKKGGHIIITGYSSCHLTAEDLTSLGIHVLRRSIPKNLFLTYMKYHLRQLYLGKIAD
jgi:2-polyprenyl-3-methyl-5-hydroxy-6-metoxy-1,4-benzoquinol methylase